MSRPLIPRPAPGGSQPPSMPPPAKNRKISTACGACKTRKTRCSGGYPRCDACESHNTFCSYDASSDQRRKIANQRNVQNLEQALRDLESHRQLLGGIIATIRAGDTLANQELIRIIQSEVDLSQMAAHVRNDLRTNPAIQRSYEAIEFVIDGPEELPGPASVLSPQLLQATAPATTAAHYDPGSGNNPESLGDFHIDYNLFPDHLRPS